MLLVNIEITRSVAHARNARHLVGIAVLLGIDQNIKIDVEHILLGPNSEAVARSVGAVLAGRSYGQWNFILVVVVLHIGT